MKLYVVVIVLSCVFLTSCGSKKSDESVETTHNEQERPIAFPPEMEPYRDIYESSAISYISISANPGKTKPWQSKFLGIPYMPKDEVYPRGVDSRPLQLLAQINFEEMPPLADYPATGILQFFISPFQSDNHVWGAYSYKAEPWDPEAYISSLSNQNYFRVIYHDTVVKNSDALLSRTPSFSDGFMPIASEAELEFSVLRAHVTNDDYRFTNFFGKDAIQFFDQFQDDAYEVGSQYYGFTYPQGQAWIGGYGIYTQGDPRVGLEDEDWILLLEIDSSFKNELEILWGDAGVGTFFIKREDLKRKDFSNIQYYWDNH